MIRTWTRTCQAPGCGKVFETEKANKKYCPECTDKRREFYRKQWLENHPDYYRVRDAKKKRDFSLRHCQVCGHPFQPTAPNHQYCGHCGDHKSAIPINNRYPRPKTEFERIGGDYKIMLREQPEKAIRLINQALAQS